MAHACRRVQDGEIQAGTETEGRDRKPVLHGTREIEKTLPPARRARGGQQSKGISGIPPLHHPEGYGDAVRVHAHHGPHPTEQDEGERDTQKREHPPESGLRAEREMNNKSEI